jgi:hypothetical protein
MDCGAVNSIAENRGYPAVRDDGKWRFNAIATIRAIGTARA